MAMNPRLLRPLATGFNPRSIAGLQLWLDADDSSTITVDTGVSAWADKSGRGLSFTQAIGNNQPATGTQTINGRNVLVFDGSNDSLDNTAQAFPAAPPMTMFFVQRIISATNFGMTYAGGQGVFQEIRQSATTGRMSFTKVSDTGWTEPNSAVGANRIYSMVFNTTGTNNAFYTNGTADALGAAPQVQANWGASQIIGQRGGNSFFANIWLAEILCWNSALSDPQRRTVEKYLGRKWGITVA